jgi:hypothetical protein
MPGWQHSRQGPGQQAPGGRQQASSQVFGPIALLLLLLLLLVLLVLVVVLVVPVDL